MAARNRLAMTLTQMNRHAEAAQVLEDLGARGGNPMDVWFRLGEIYERRLNDPVESARKPTRRCRPDRRATTKRSES